MAPWISLPEVTQTIRHLSQLTLPKCFVSFMILIWDHIITFGEEVEYIWKGRKGTFVLLFLLNRYLTPLGFIVNLLAYMSPFWTKERCKNYVVYEGSTTVVGISIVALMMLLRIRALYHKQKAVVVFTGVCFCVELSVNAWLLSHAIPVRHNNGIHACTMIFDESVGWAASAFAWMPLAYDTMVFGLTLYKTVGPMRKKTAGKISQVILTDGILYYSVILTVNLVLTIMLVAAPPGLQNICSHLTVTMMSRITLSLRKQAHGREIDTRLCSIKSISRSTPHFVHRQNGPGVVHTATDSGDITSILMQASSVVHNDDEDMIHICAQDDASEAVCIELEERKGRQAGNYYPRAPAPAAIHHAAQSTSGPHTVVIV
ncbi:hypothetical protein BC629DRAFT_1442790 [Irpex lacteus]|nr:hypothetical protein BC629DRAFT_1442790 [Irpex lacteus]